MEQSRNIVTEEVSRGVCRLLVNMGLAVLSEFKLGNGRRMDVMGLDPKGRFTGVEIKSGAADFKADGKWPEYLPYCDAFYFAVRADFPRELLPEGCGIIVADVWDGAILRPAPPSSHAASLNGSRRRAQTIAFARAAAMRLSDP
ncbi:MmcB family DNA repair protein [Magnetospira sp. QH-2]|uniref:MmcB family DNA repair protein n=1 Tax=Magnetospira sp. (strain QH-2) TaxID=1288970 RepID=UPI0003E812CF|nr:MmcB family DNA repair protein [Magnetospira sp. QH-2]CCQ75576.1 conserved protein of unknown function [Magnetospira sp. QH-2]